MDCVFADFGIDSYSRFPFRVRTDTQMYKLTDANESSTDATTKATSVCNQQKENIGNLPESNLNTASWIERL